MCCCNLYDLKHAYAHNEHWNGLYPTKKKIHTTLTDDLFGQTRMYLEMWREQRLLLERLFTVGTLVGSHVAVSFYVLHQMTLLNESFTAVGAQKRFLSWKNKSIQLTDVTFVRINPRLFLIFAYPNASLGATWAPTVDKIASGKFCTLQVDRCGVSCGFPEPRIAQSPSGQTLNLFYGSYAAYFATNVANVGFFTSVGSLVVQ